MITHLAIPRLARLIASRLLAAISGARGLQVATLLVAGAIAEAAQEELRRHPLEVLAITEPQRALEQIQPAIREMGAAASEQRALLYLAQANACRVIADWACQQMAASNAVQDANEMGIAQIRIRALIVQARASNAMRDYVRGEELLSQAEVELRAHPHGILEADLALAYSSLSWQLGKFEVSARYAEDALTKVAAPGLNAQPNSSEVLTATVDVATTIRLLRNAARARLQLQNLDQAQLHIERALDLVERIDDPKLAGELYLESARLFRVRGDYRRQLDATQKVVDISKKLDNSQLYGQAMEAEAQAHLDQGKWDMARDSFTRAARSFAELKLQRDELRIWSQLLPLAIRLDTPRQELEQGMQRWIELESALSSSERAKAATDFETRLRVIENQAKIDRLEADKQASEAQIKLSKENARLAFWLAAAGGGMALLFAVFVLGQRNARVRVEASERRLRSVAENLPAMVAHVDRAQRIIYANAELRRRTGFADQDVVGRSLLELLGAQHHARLAPYLDTVLAGERVVADDHFDQDDGRRYYQVTMVPEFRDGVDVCGIFLLDQDVTDLRLAKLSLEQLANMDGLTNLMNRRYFDDRLSHALYAAGRGKPVVLLLIDLDGFKPINDRFGHLAGDAVLREVARRIRLSTRRDDSLARFGGDEFAVLLESADLDAGVAVAHKLLAQLEIGYRHDDHTIALAASIGIAQSSVGQTSVELIACADQALYKAKADGKNQYQIWAT